MSILLLRTMSVSLLICDYYDRMTISFIDRYIEDSYNKVKNRR